MSEEFAKAKNLFRELALESVVESEKNNRYMALHHLAAGLERLAGDIDEIKQNVRNLDEG